MSFNNKVVLVTGSGAGIGAATAILFSKEGANVVIVDKNEDSAKKTAEKCKEFNNKLLVITADVSKDARKIVQDTIDTFGRLDVLVNNAGIVRAESILSGSIMKTYDEIMNTNIRAVVHLTSLSAPHLANTKGAIVNIGSIASVSVKTSTKYPSYGISKAGVAMFTKLSALELAEVGIRVNAIQPGLVNTSILTDVKGHSIYDYVEGNVFQRLLDPEEIADLIMYLSSDKARSITGSCYVLDNGMTLM